MTKEECMREASELEERAKKSLVAFILSGQTQAYHMIMDEVDLLHKAALIDGDIDRIEFLAA